MSAGIRPVFVAAVLLVRAAAPVCAQNCGRAAGERVAAGWTAYRSGDVVTAATAFKAARSLCPASTEAMTGLSYVSLRQGRAAQARAWADSVLKREPKNVDALVARSMAAQRLNEYPTAQAMLQRALKQDSTREDVRQLIAQLPAGLGEAPPRPQLVLPDTVEIEARAAQRRFEVLVNGKWQPFYVKGINLGAALPGKNPSEFPDSLTYARWIGQMHEMGANTIRVYTIHPAHFYQALLQFNEAHQDSPLRLIHGVWTELPRAGNFDNAAFVKDFQAEMRHVVDLLHGRADIAPHAGHASGFYTADVSRFVLAYIIGREWEPKAVVAYNKLHRGNASYAGKYLSIASGNAMDAWLARMCDWMVAYETQTYRLQHPIAFTNWPTLDPLHHPTETSVAEEVAIRRALHDRIIEMPKEYDNDAVGLDANRIVAQPAFKAGPFASYHAYPYYPDFMLREPGHYAGYLRALVDHHGSLPVLISEYGVPMGAGIAHLQPDGFHHGGHSEAEGARLNAELTREIAASGAAGGAFFAWIDEWFKKNWVTIEFEQPADRNRLWLNTLDAEQQYGVIALRPGEPFAQQALSKDSAVTASAASDEAFFRLQLSTSDSLRDVIVGFDVIDPARGDFRLPGKVGPRLPAGIELALALRGDTLQLLADSAASQFRIVAVGQNQKRAPVVFERPANAPAGFFSTRAEMLMNRPFISRANADGAFVPLQIITNRRRFGRDSTEYLAAGYDRGILAYGADPDGSWTRTRNTLEVRIPWLLLNFTDPSSGRVLQGVSGTTVGTRSVDEIRIIVATRDASGAWHVAPVASYHLQRWEQPHWHERVRPTFEALKSVFQSINGH